MKTDQFRPDIQGLRALAVSFVVLFHANFSLLGGGYVGVDVFFVISGYLITSHLLGSLQKNNHISFSAFYARRILRIIPAAFFVLAASALFAYAFLPPLRSAEISENVAATALYIPNIYLAIKGSDYLAEDSPSPFQHYWSLGIEEQFYLTWPLFLAIFWKLTSQRGASLTWAVAAVVALSLALCAWATPVNTSWAFFGLPTRAWELGTGGLVAVMAQRPRRLQSSGFTSSALATVGLALVFGAAVIFDKETQFPGIAATIPVFGTAAIIFAGLINPENHVSRLLALRPFQFLGTHSYSIYLWHWPVFIIPAATLRQPLGEWSYIGLTAVTLLLAMASYRLVEEPFRRSKQFLEAPPWKIITGALLASGVIAGAAHVKGRLDQTGDLHSGRQAPEAALLAEPQFTDFVPSNLKPSLREASKDNPSLYKSGCHVGFEVTRPKDCVFGNERSPKTIVLFGDSHAAQWFPAINEIAVASNIKLIPLTKSACPSVDTPRTLKGVRYFACESWRQAALARIAYIKPDLLIISNLQSTNLVPDGQTFEEAWQMGLARTLEKVPPGTKVAVIADTPEQLDTPAICLSAHLDRANVCGRSPTDAFHSEAQKAEKAAAAAFGASYIDMTPFFCTSTECAPIIGNWLVYRDRHHITATFSKALAPQLGAKLADVWPAIRE